MKIEFKYALFKAILIYHLDMLNKLPLEDAAGLDLVSQCCTEHCYCSALFVCGFVLWSVPGMLLCQTQMEDCV